MWLLLCILLFFGACAQEQEPDKAPGGPPCIAVDAAVHDFGEILNTKPVQHTYWIENRGHQDLLIEKIEAKRYALFWDDLEKKTLAPGERTGLTVTLNPKTLSDDEERRIFVYSNDPERAKLELTLKAFIRIDFKFANPFVYFKDIHHGERASEAVRIDSFLDEPLSLTHIKTSHDFISTSFRSDAEKDLYYLDVAVDTAMLDFEKTRVSGKVFFDTNSPAYPKGSLTVVLSLAVDLQVLPGSFESADLEIGKPYEETFILQNKKSIEYTLSDVCFSDDSIHVKYWDRKGDLVTIGYEVSDTLRYRTLSGRFVLDIDCEHPTKISIPFEGAVSDQVAEDRNLIDRRRRAVEARSTGVEEEEVVDYDPATSPRIVVDKEIHDFGTVNLGDEIEAHFQISNQGFSDLVITDVRAGCACTVVDDWEGKVIPPGGAEDLVVKVRTANKRPDFMKTIRIYSNDPVNKSKSVDIKAYIYRDYDQKRYVRLHDVRKGAPFTERIEVESYMDHPLEIRDLECNLDFATVEYERGGKDNLSYLVVKVDTTSPAVNKDPITGWVTYKTNSKMFPEGKFTLNILPIEDIKADPRRISLRRMTTGNDDRGAYSEITLTNVLGKDFSIRKIDPGLDCVTFKILNHEGCRATIEWSLKGELKEGAQRSVAVVYFDYPDQETLEIPISVISYSPKKRTVEETPSSSGN